MITPFTADDLIAFEEEIAALFNAGKIRSPIHLYSGNEAQMIHVFRSVKESDWVCCSWRSHHQCLLKGVPPAELKATIIAGRSIALCFPKQRIISSAIVGGILPIAVGLAMGIKLRGGPEQVWCFMGDMTAETGIAHECVKYATNHNLPVNWIIEDNGLSTFTPTRQVWENVAYAPFRIDGVNGRITGYTYRSRWPHSGAGQFVKF